MIDTTEQATTLTESSHAADEKPRVIGNTRKLNIPGDLVNRVTQNLPDEQRSALRWLHAYAQEENLSATEVGNLLKRDGGKRYDGNTVYKVLTGRHEAKLETFVAAVLDFKDHVENKSKVTRAPFVRTQLAKQIEEICDLALVLNQIAFIFNDSQIGKTAALENYAKEHNHGQTIYVRMPDGGSLTDFCFELAKQLRVSPQADNLRQRLVAAFDDRMLLIVDEAHQVFPPLSGPTPRLRTLEFIRRIFDQSKCGLVIVGTKIFEREMNAGRSKEFLKQLGRRKVITAPLDERPTAEDLVCFARAYKLPAATGRAMNLQSRIVRDEGLGQWVSFLKAASLYAAKQEEKLTWQHVLDWDAKIAKYQLSAEQIQAAQ
ncbi:MAG TPA: ATP-binding protein [Verrucomicrobiae bacterium]